jgi:hypothetical protein
MRATMALADGPRMAVYVKVRPNIEPGDAVRVWWDERLAAVIL